jgi:glutathione S-transferase
MLKVLGRTSSINVRKVLWSCAVLRLEVAQEDWGSGFRDPRTPEYLALNPNGLVPVLIDGDVVLWESNTICRYLAARAGRDDVLPTRPAARALVEQWMDWQNTDLNNAWRYAFLSLVRHSPAHRDADAVAGSVVEWNRHMTILDERLATTGAYVAGDGFTLADLVLGLATYRWLMTPIERPSLPAVDAWFARLAQEPGFDEHCGNGSP